MKKIQVALAGAVLAATVGVGGGAAFARTHAPAGAAARHQAQCTALLSTINGLAPAISSATPGSAEYVSLKSLSDQATAKYHSLGC